MSTPRKILIFGGLALAIVGMCYGLVYAVFIEHQTLDGLGGSLTTAFVKGAERNLPAAESSIDTYAHNAYVYVRQVDTHSHWIGLAMILILLGVAFDHLGLSDGAKSVLAVLLLIGAVTFPFGVLMQTWMGGLAPKIIASVGAASVTVGMAGSAWGFSRAQ